ncbi:MAG: hypothetical protein HWE14_08190 [Flavobacteriia bacterium]|nr:hypothetical protein [Flavobacteriia bacterium]
MSTVELRKKLHDYVNAADERLLKIMTAVFESYSNSAEDIVAHTVREEPLTREQYVDKVRKADQSIDKGNFTDVDDLEDEMRDW